MPSLLPSVVQAFDSEIETSITDKKMTINHIVTPLASSDKNGNKIHDNLEKLVAKKSANEVITTIVTFDCEISNDFISRVESLGGEIVSSWSIIYGAAIRIPVDRLHSLAQQSEVVLVTENYECKSLLSKSSQQINVRPYVWDTLGFKGDPEQAIAILDTGVDDSHPDFQDKIIYWRDFIGRSVDYEYDEYSSPCDYFGHGTSCASIAVGTGESAGKNEYVSISRTLEFPPNVPEMYGFASYVDVEQNGSICIDISWDDISGNDPDDTLFITLDTNGDNEANSTEDLHIFGDYSAGSLKLDYSSATPGRYRYLFGQKTEGELGASIIQINITRPAADLSDTNNNYQGMAPNCKIVALKILDDYGTGNSLLLLDAFDWISNFGAEHNVVVVSCSLGFSEEVESIDKAMDNLVEQGFVCVVSAGNSFQDDGFIGSPGTADKAITVGAINSQDEITYYSSNGEYLGPYTKPDVVAPGGSVLSHDSGWKIVAADTNDADYTEADQIYDLYGVNRYFSDEKVFDDYACRQGTSMSAPYVSGLAALIIQAMGDDWSYSLKNALLVKNLICGTATEVLTGETIDFLSNTPELNRGERDNIEGFGKIHSNAAIEAYLTQIQIGESESHYLGSGPFEDQSWARRIEVPRKTTLTFSVTLPATADYDLFIYDSAEDFSETKGGYLAASTEVTAGITETITYSTRTARDIYVVVKCVTGEGEFTLTIGTISYQGGIGLHIWLIFAILGLANLSFLRKKLK
ncbi:MAG: S8 family serine peptidase [Candidatus Heimdallarchaeota archaeon]